MFGNLLKGLAYCATLSLATVGALTFVPDESWEHFPEALAPTRAQLAEFGIAPIKYRVDESQSQIAQDAEVPSGGRSSLTTDLNGNERLFGVPQVSIDDRTSQEDAKNVVATPSSVRIRDRIASTEYVAPSESNATSGAYDVQALRTSRARGSQSSTQTERRPLPTSPSMFKGITSPKEQEIAEQEIPKQEPVKSGASIGVFQSSNGISAPESIAEEMPQVESNSGVGIFQNEFFADESSVASEVKQNEPPVAQNLETTLLDDPVAMEPPCPESLDFASQQDPVVQPLTSTLAMQTDAIASNDQTSNDRFVTTGASTAELAVEQAFPPLEQQDFSTQINTLEQERSATSQLSQTVPQQDQTLPSQLSTNVQTSQELVQTTIPQSVATQAFIPQTSATIAQPSPSLEDALRNAERVQTDEQARDVFFVLNQYRSQQGTTLSEADLTRLNAALDRLAYEVFYNPKRSILEPPRQTVQGETLASIAKECQVTPELLAAINGLQLAPDAPLTPGVLLKVARGPVSADASVSKKELTLSFNGLYAGRFKFGVPQQWLTYRGLRVVESKIPNPSCDAVGIDGVKTTIPGGAENNPLGSCWIGLNGGMGLQGTNRPELVGSVVSENGGYLFSNNEISQLEILLPIGAPVSFSD